MKPTTTALAFTLGVTLVLTAAAPGRAHAEQVGKYKGNGAYVQAYGADTTGCRYFYISVTRGGTTAAPQTYAYYDVYDSCAGTWSFGDGIIPNAAFKIGRKTLSVNFTAGTGFHAEGERLTIALTFTKDSVFTYRWSGHSRWEYYGHVVQHHGSGTQNSATVSGTIGGSAVQAFWAITGTGREHYLEFDRGKN